MVTSGCSKNLRSEEVKGQRAERIGREREDDGRVRRTVRMKIENWPGRETCIIL